MTQAVPGALGIVPGDRKALMATGRGKGMRLSVVSGARDSNQLGKFQPVQCRLCDEFATYSRKTGRVGCEVKFMFRRLSTEFPPSPPPPRCLDAMRRFRVVNREPKYERRGTQS